jgi:hypothetical protein
MGRAGRKAFVSGKLKWNTIEATVISDEYAPTLVRRWTPAGAHA